MARWYSVFELGDSRQSAWVPLQVGFQPAQRPAEHGGALPRTARTLPGPEQYGEGEGRGNRGEPVAGVASVLDSHTH